MKNIVIIDYGLGNVYGLQQACSAAGLETVITNNKKQISDAYGIILPGVGAFHVAMKNLKQLEIIEDIKKFAKSGKTLLGLCLGMQLIMKKSYEFGEHEGLNFIDGEIEYLGKNKKKNKILKIHHIGWNIIEINKKISGDKLFKGLPKKFDVYFVHSFCLLSTSSNNILSTTTYEGINFCSAVKKDNIIGLQFHPEKSGERGLKLLSNVFKK